MNHIKEILGSTFRVPGIAGFSHGPCVRAVCCMVVKSKQARHATCRLQGFRSLKKHVSCEDAHPTRQGCTAGMRGGSSGQWLTRFSSRKTSRKDPGARRAPKGFEGLMSRRSPDTWWHPPTRNPKQGLCHLFPEVMILEWTARDSSPSSKGTGASKQAALGLRRPLPAGPCAVSCNA